MFAQLDVLVTIPIDKRDCFTHRFSPTGFILNASDCKCCHPSLSDRIQEPIRSVQYCFSAAIQFVGPAESITTSTTSYEFGHEEGVNSIISTNIIYDSSFFDVHH
jgi:hypothetical protein